MKEHDKSMLGYIQVEVVPKARKKIPKQRHDGISEAAS